MLVLLLRLRQICSHPALIQENAEAFIIQDDDCDEGAPAEARTELARARELVSGDFVARMKYKRREIALKRMDAEKQVKPIPSCSWIG